MSHGPILQGDVLRFAETGRHVRVVWIEQPADLLVVFDLEGDEGFSRASFSGTEAMIAAGSVKPVFEHGFDAPIRPGPISKKRADRGKVLMKAIEPLLEMGVELFDDRKRGSAVMRAAADGPDRKTLHAALDRYFRHGMTPAAVIPGFLNCGAPNRKKRRGLVKLGRPRRLGKRPGTNVTPEIEKIFELGIRRYYGRNGRISLAKARVLMLTELCMERRIDPDTRRIVYTAKPLYEEEDFPTIRQLSYWFKENADIFAIKRERTGRKSYDRNLRGITGSAQSHVRGPGSRYEIDATIINIYVVSELEDGLIIGRPVLYVVVDVFSKMIVGFYIGLEGPSWVGAMMALVSVVENKREFCARYGVIIGDGEWPCEFLPEALLGDRGEIASRIHQAELEQAFRGYWGAALHHVPGILSRAALQGDWLASLVRPRPRAMHPIYHLLLRLFLDERAEVQPPFGSGPWECLNPLAPHLGDFVVTDLRVRRDRSHLYGDFECGCGYVYTRRRDVDGTVGPARYRLYGPSFAPALREAIARGEGLRAVARRLKLDPKTVMREAAIAGVATPWRLAPSGAVARGNPVHVRCRSQSAVQTAHHGSCARDWSFIDRLIARAVGAEAAAVHSLLPPVRVTFSELERRMTSQSWIRDRSAKLPRTIARIDSVVESTNAFRERRLGFALSEAEGATNVTASCILRSAGLPTTWMPRVRAAMAARSTVQVEEAA